MQENIQPITYTNKKGKKVVLEVTTHALNRIARRTLVMQDKHLMALPPMEQIRKLMTHATRVTSLNGKEKRRVKRYGKDTMYFRHGNYTVVVQNAAILTVEISSKGNRGLNKVRKSQLGKYPPLPDPVLDPVQKPCVAKLSHGTAAILQYRQEMNESLEIK